MTAVQARMSSQKITCSSHPVQTLVSYFHGESGVGEFHLMLQPLEYGSMSEQLEWLSQAYREALATLGLPADSALWRRFFCSDLPNQAAVLQQYQFADPAAQDELCAVSWVGQPPIAPAKVALWAYHASDANGALEKSKSGTSLAVQRGELTHHFSTYLTDSTDANSYEQTTAIFAKYEEYLLHNGMNLAENVQRTWFFVQNVDGNYQGLVDARRELFARQGLTADTHYIASTGIEGRAGDVDAKVMLDAYAVAGINPRQINYLAALDHLSPTSIYGVTFERGTAIAYRDRVHVTISGTASIDRDGHIVHPGDVQLQLERTLENITALLQQAHATLDDVSVFIIYVRDISDMAIMQQLMSARFGTVPMLVVLAPVCRPGWLVEIECLAIIAAENPGLPGF